MPRHRGERGSRFAKNAAFTCLYFILTHFSLMGAEQGRTCLDLDSDDNIQWIGLKHDSFDEQFRQRFGAQATGSEPLTLAFQTCANDVTRVRIRVWDDVLDKDFWITMEKRKSLANPQIGYVDIYEAKVKVPDSPTILYYFLKSRMEKLETIISTTILSLGVVLESLLITGMTKALFS